VLPARWTRCEEVVSCLNTGDGSVGSTRKGKKKVLKALFWNGEKKGGHFQKAGMWGKRISRKAHKGGGRRSRQLRAGGQKKWASKLADRHAKRDDEEKKRAVNFFLTRTKKREKEGRRYAGANEGEREKRTVIRE